MKILSAFLLVVGMSKSWAFQVTPDNSDIHSEAVKKIKTPMPMDTTPDDAKSGLPPLQERIDPGPPDYWFHPQIHTFGNTGFLGGLHAAVAPFFTKLIDILAYDGNPIRDQVSKELRSLVGKPNARVLDLCCGVGISTRALQAAFHDAELVMGIDTSPEMVEMAKVLSSENILTHFARTASRCVEGGAKAVQQGVKRFPSFAIGNAEGTGLKGGSFDLVTVMYGFHEIPFLRRYVILREIRRLLADGATLAVIDISPDYVPKPSMLAGEPYVLEYKRHIMRQLRSIRGFANFEFKAVVPGHVGVWLLTRNVSEGRGVGKKSAALPLADSSKNE